MFLVELFVKIYFDFEVEFSYLVGIVQVMICQIGSWEDCDCNMGVDFEILVMMVDIVEEYVVMLSVYVYQFYFGSLKVCVGGCEQIFYIGKYVFCDVGGLYYVVSWDSEVGSFFYFDVLDWVFWCGSKGQIWWWCQFDVV